MKSISKCEKNHRRCIIQYAAYRKGEDIAMRKITTTNKINTALVNRMLEVTKAEVNYKTSGKTETVNASILCGSLDFLCKSGIFMGALGWHFEKIVNLMVT